MAIALEMINLILPVEAVRARYAGGWDGFVRDHADMLGETIWHDDHLLRDGAMDYGIVEAMIRTLEAKGLVPLKTVGGERVWQDMCVLDPADGEPTRPCDWIAVDAEQGCAWLAGQPRGRIVGRSDFQAGTV